MIKSNTLWAEKYRPQSIKDLVGSQTLKDKLQTFIDTNDVSHLLLYGPPGTGKTTIAKILVASIDCDYIYINASAENGIETVREKIKNFVSSIGFQPLKIVILDECDFATVNSQAALRSMMEEHSAHARFILTCNYLTKIIDPIRSRCQEMEVIPPSPAKIAVHIAKMLTTEGVKYSSVDVASIVKSLYPDIRKIINKCQNLTVDNNMSVDNGQVVLSSYCDEVYAVLSNRSQKYQDDFKKIRQIIADNRVKDFATLYKFLYDRSDELWEGQQYAMAVISIADAQYTDTFVVDKEINAMSLILKLLTQL